MPSEDTGSKRLYFGAGGGKVEINSEKLGLCFAALNHGDEFF